MSLFMSYPFLCQYYPINRIKASVLNGTVRLSVPFPDIPSNAVIAKPIKHETTGQWAVCQNILLCANIKYPPIRHVVITNIVSDPANDFLLSPNLYFLLFMHFPITAANPSPYAITNVGTNPRAGFLYIPNDMIANINKDNA